MRRPKHIKSIEVTLRNRPGSRLVVVNWAGVAANREPCPGCCNYTRTRIAADRAAAQKWLAEWRGDEQKRMQLNRQSLWRS